MKTFAFYLCTFALLLTGCRTPSPEKTVTLPFPQIQYAPGDKSVAPPTP